MQWIRSNLKIVIPATLAVVGLVAYLAFGVFGVQFLFIDDKVDEAAPVFDSGADSAVGVVATTEAPSTSAAPPATTLAPEDGTGTDGGDETPPATQPETTAPATAPPTAPPTTVPQIVTTAQGEFVSRDHPGRGTASVLTDGSSQRFLRFTDFATDNGPDLNVYLTVSDAEGPEGAFDDDFIDLGNLKGNIGDQNYEIPPDVDLSVYDTVVVWCVRFSSAFTAADLIAT